MREIFLVITELGLFEFEGHRFPQIMFMFEIWWTLNPALSKFLGEREVGNIPYVDTLTNTLI